MAEGDTLEPGARLGQFALVGKLGAGGMGEVWEAIDANLGRRVALKLLQSEQTSDALPQLRAEARSMATLNHPNIAVVYDIDAVGDRVFIAMELLPGGTLRHWLKAEQRGWREIIDKLIAAGRGLDAAHRAGLVHCDFKPDNVLLGANGEVRVADFGIARQLGPREPTGEYRFAGTPAYMAPEQITGRDIDGRADQFSFCVTALEALTGERPFESSTVTGVPTVAQKLAAMTRPRETPTLAKSSAPRGIERVLQRGLSTDPDRRFESVRDLLDALEEAAQLPVRRRRIAITIAGVMTLVALAVGFVATRRAAELSCGDLAHEPSHNVWHNTKSAPLRAAFGSTGLPYARDVAGRTILALEGWRDQWRGARVDSCTAARDGDKRGAERAACLDAQLQQMRKRVNRLVTNVTPEIVDGALELATLDVDACKYLDEAPTDLAQRTQLAKLRELLDDLDDARITGTGDALALARVIADAESAGWKALANRARVSAALLAEREDDCTRVLELTAFVAKSEASRSQSGQLDLSARAWEIRIECLLRRASSIDTSELDGAITAVRALAGELRGSSHELRLVTDAAKGQARLGRLEEAERGCREAIALAKVRLDTGRAADAHRCLADVSARRRDPVTSVNQALAAVAARESAFGTEHALVASDLEALAVVFEQAARGVDGVAARLRALAIRERLRGPDSPALAGSVRAIAAAILAFGRRAEARAYADRALALAERDDRMMSGDRVVYDLEVGRAWHGEPEGRRAIERATMRCAVQGPARPCGEAHAELADALAESNGCSAAIEHYDRARSFLEKLQVPDPSSALAVVARRARCLVETGRVQDGLAGLESAARDVDRVAAPTAAGVIELSLARVLESRDRARALALARSALALFELARDAPHAIVAREWLAAHAR